MAPRESPRVVVVGFGRVGGALCLGLKKKRWKVAAFPRSGVSLRRAAALGIPIAGPEALEGADVAILAVPDGALPEVARDLVPYLGPKTALVHCAGALDLEAFGRARAVASRPRGSLHPLVAVSSQKDALAGNAAALSATSPALLRILRRMADDLGLFTIQVPEDRRPAYHAGAVMAAGGVVAALAAGVRALSLAGIREADAVRALLPLSRSALRGVETRGLSAALTGPIRRGDAPVVAAHLQALPPDVREVYLALSRQALALVGAELQPRVRRALATLLRPGG